MISDITSALDAIKELLDPAFTVVFTETKNKLSADEYPAVVMTVDSGEIQLVSDGSHNTDVTIQIDVLDRGSSIQKKLIEHTNSIITLLNPYVEVTDTNVRAIPQSFTFTFDEEDSRSGMSSIIYQISL